MVKAIKKRRAVREYLNQAISEEIIDKLIDAAMFAPSANALYPWELVIVDDLQLREKLSKITPWSLHAKDAPLSIVIIGKEKESPYWIEDCSIVAENIWLQAADAGLGCCWNQIRNNNAAEKDIKELLQIPADHRVLCFLSIGFPAVPPDEHSDKEFKKEKVKYNKYK